MWKPLHRIDGVDYEIDGSGLVRCEIAVPEPYEDDYFAQWDTVPQAQLDAVSAVRLNLLQQFVSAGTILDFGCGTGEFLDYVRRMAPALVGYGYDTRRHARNKAVNWTFHSMAPVLGWGKWCAVCAFDVLEHVEDPMELVRSMPTDCWAVSVPYAAPDIVTDKEAFTCWRHRRPTEHRWHFSKTGLRTMFERCGFTQAYEGHPEDPHRVNNTQAFPNILSGVFLR